MQASRHFRFHIAASLLALCSIPLSAKANDTLSATSCPGQSENVDELSEAFTCGRVSGSLRALYYSTHNAYFEQGYNQDTISYGGTVKYETAPFHGFSIGISANLLRGIDHPDSSHLVDSIGKNQTAIGEAYLKWQSEKFRISAGNIRLDIPFVSDYDWRITPILFRAVDVHYGDKTDFVQVTKIWRYKPWSDDRFLSTTAYTDVTQRTNGMWAIGAGRSASLGDKLLTGQLWYESYDDYVKLGYAETHLLWQDTTLRPDLALQFVRGTSEGRALAGEVDSTSYGAQFGLNLSPELSWSVGYDHIAASANTWKDGALVTPYAHNSASGPYFAAPFFTSVQDLGSGNAYATKLTYVYSQNLTMGGQYSFMDLKPTATSASLDQSEYMAFIVWNFGGKMKGLSISEFIGLQTSPVYDFNYVENRLTLQYDF